MFTIGSMHPLVVHLPLVLLPIAVMFTLADVLFPRTRLRMAALLLLLIGVVAIVLAKETGEEAAYQARMLNGAVPDITATGIVPQVVAEGKLLHTHALLGEWTRNLFVGMLLVESVLVFATHPACAQWRRRWSLSEHTVKIVRLVWFGVAIVGIGMVVVTGHYGGSLVYDHGVGVMPHQMLNDPGHVMSMQH